MSKRYDEDKTYAAMVSMFVYNYSKDLLEDLYARTMIINKDNYISISDVDHFWYDNEGANVFWGMMVLMYGNYGTSPRSGWLEISDELKSFLKDFIEDYGEDSSE